ncbi:MAG: winged helix-turn-helix transcriptional regulator [Acidimicrobiales bacterium]
MMQPTNLYGWSARASPPERLNHLVGAGVLEKVLYSRRPPRYDYRLTGKGQELWPVLSAMRQWGDRYAAPGGPPVELRHTRCGMVAEAVTVCSECGEAFDARNAQVRPGPGAVEPLVRSSPIDPVGTSIRS